jgi:hypothetical protein
MYSKIASIMASSLNREAHRRKERERERERERDWYQYHLQMCTPTISLVIRFRGWFVFWMCTWMDDIVHIKIQVIKFDLVWVGL